MNVYRLLLLRKFKSQNGPKAKIKGKACNKSVYDNDEHLHVHQKKTCYVFSVPQLKFSMCHIWDAFFKHTKNVQNLTWTNTRRI